MRHRGRLLAALHSRRRSFEGHVLEHVYHSFTHRLERLVTPTQRVLEQLAMIAAPEIQDPREGEDALLDREIWLTVPLVFDVAHKQATVELDAALRVAGYILEVGRTNALYIQCADFPGLRLELDAVETVII